MGEVEFNRDDGYKVKIVGGGDYKEPGGGIRKPTQEEIDSYSTHRMVVMILFGIVVAVLLLVVVVLIATVDRCAPPPKEQPWWKSGVMYNVHPRSFKDSDGDGVGDFNGINEKLDYLKEIGINILYLSSIFKIDKDVDYGYAVIDFKDTNEQYGSLEHFEKLLENAHAKGLKVIIEFVPSDTSTKHGWFQASRKNISGSKRDWYIWKDDVNNAMNHSTNSTSKNTSAWEKDSATGQYYLHQWGKGKANLNWSNPEVQEEMKNVLKFWLDKGVDGFRVVSVARLFAVPTDPPTNDVSKIHVTLNKWHNYTTKESPNSVLIGASHNSSMNYYGSETLPELDIVMNFKLVPENDELMAGFYTADKFKKIIDGYFNDVPEGKWPSWALTSWVHKRMGSNVPTKLAKSLNVFLLFLPGTPVVFYGDEIGMKDVISNKYPNDTNKSPMQWENKTSAGFSTNTSTWFGAVGDPSVLNAKDDQHGIKATFKQAIKLRAEGKAFLKGNLTSFKTSKVGTVLAYSFKSKPQFVVVMNFDKNNDGRINLAREFGEKKWQLKLHTCDKQPKENNSKESVEVPPMALFVYKAND